tara:strand:+ start:625 stop:765 length:141 start_codon:yes stop_codon:yes gene_type:complete
MNDKHNGMIAKHVASQLGSACTGDYSEVAETGSIKLVDAIPTDDHY